MGVISESSQELRRRVGRGDGNALWALLERAAGGEDIGLVADALERPEGRDVLFHLVGLMGGDHANALLGLLSRLGDRVEPDQRVGSPADVWTVYGWEAEPDDSEEANEIPGFVVVSPEIDPAARSVLRACERFYNVVLDGRELPEEMVDTAVDENGLDLYSPNCVFGPYVTSSGLLVHADTKGEIQAGMVKTMLRILKEELVADGLPAYVHVPSPDRLGEMIEATVAAGAEEWTPAGR
ncbi:hypothetical protein DFJ69_5976 [Thermomonospora umbrina]|uniref:Uncharacterized protein n=2 Tax=Thermomonospora umbrina TaxID=111806 RepID=A0A3D9SWW1_9ACTN|nr:hypothetical protein DFJ69_5976 [Thermomonospora umbrina]